MRSGMLPTCLCVGFGAACAAAMYRADRVRVASFRDVMLERIRSLFPDAMVVRALDGRQPGNLNLPCPASKPSGSSRSFSRTPLLLFASMDQGTRLRRPSPANIESSNAHLPVSLDGRLSRSIPTSNTSTPPPERTCALSECWRAPPAWQAPTSLRQYFTHEPTNTRSGAESGAAQSENQNFRIKSSN